MRLLSNCLLVCLFLSISSMSHAHHGWSGYIIDFEMEAEVSRTRFANPHDQIWVVDAEGNEWRFLLAPPMRNRKFGYDENSITVGQKVRIVGQRSEAQFEGKVHLIYNAEGENIYTYYYGNGETSLERLSRKRK